MKAFFLTHPMALAGQGFWLLLAVALLGGMAGGGAISGCSRGGGPGTTTGNEKVVTAQGFMVTDQSGKTRAELKVNNDGVPILRLLDAKGKVAAALSVRANGTPILTFPGHATLEVTSDGTPALSLADRQGRSAATITISYDGRPTFGLFNPSTKTSAVLMADDTAGHLLLVDPATKALTHLP